MRGLFITFEGSDGVGKSTQIKRSQAWLERLGYNVVVTREPGGGELAERIRTLVLDPRLNITPLTELFLYEAARAEHVARVIRPALETKKIVLCDRYTDATVAYQGFGRGLQREVAVLNRLAMQRTKPDLTILLNLNARHALKKAEKRDNGRPDRIEKEGVSFQKKVQQGYLAVARREPRRVKVVAVQADIESTQKLIQKYIQEKLHGYSRSKTRGFLSYRSS